MRLCKAVYRNRRGELCETKRWYIEVRLDGKVRRVAAFDDRAASEELGRKFQRLLSLRTADLQPDAGLAAWVERLGPRLRSALERLGAVGPQRLAASRPLAELLDEFQKTLENRERTAKHIQLVVARARRVLDVGEIKFWSQLEALRVESALRRLREQPMSAQSVNHHLVSLRSFIRWMLSNGIVNEDPTRVLRPLNVRVDRRRERRALEPDEIRSLLRSTAAGPVFQSLSGPARALAYRVVLESGLRARELVSLRIASLRGLDSAEPTLTVLARDSKHRREDTLPIGRDLARELAAHVKGRSALEPVFRLNRSWRPCEMLRADLKRAGIAERDEEGAVVDFHSLRVTFISGLARAGVAPKTVQTLARHATALLTYERYVRIGRNDERRALDRLPDLSGCTGAQASR
jgi:site-specific recombinase XerC